jgi:hypothetical protein
MTLQDICRRSVVAHRACPRQKEIRELRYGSSVHQHQGTQRRKKEKKGRKKRKLEINLKGPHGGHDSINIELKSTMGATERKNRKARVEDRRKEGM